LPSNEPEILFSSLALLLFVDQGHKQREGGVDNKGPQRLG